jgi:hypothetical protein
MNAVILNTECCTMSSSSCLGSGTQYNGPTCDTTLCVLSVAFYCCADISIKRPWYNILNGSYCIMNVIPGNTEGGSITVLLSPCWFGISCMTTNNFCFYLQNRLIQTSQTGGQQYSDTPISIPWYTVSSSSSPYSCLLTSTVTLPPLVFPEQMLLEKRSDIRFKPSVA